MKNKVIKVLNVEHGKKVIEYWLSRYPHIFQYNGDSINCYYGFVDDKFGGFRNVPRYTEIITLPEKKPEYPKLMWVWDNCKESKVKMEVHGRIGTTYLTGGPAQYSSWLNAEDFVKSEVLRPIDIVNKHLFNQDKYALKDPAGMIQDIEDYVNFRLHNK